MRCQEIQLKVSSDIKFRDRFGEEERLFRLYISLL